MRVQPIPGAWIELVTRILDEGDGSVVEWTTRARQQWAQFGREQNAYELLVSALRKPGVLGHQVVGMLDRRDGSHCECWEFLCPHPWGSTVAFYAKIGVHHSRLHINLFSLHVDDGTERLAKAIVEYKKAHKASNKTKKR